MNDKYQEFLTRKMQRPVFQGFEYDINKLNPNMYIFQRDIVLWALRLGKAAVFSQVGTGKTIMQLSWAKAINEYTGKPVLILAPLAVSGQTIREGAKFGIDAVYRKDETEIEASDKIIVTNYERLDKFSNFILSIGGVVLDECFPAGTPIDCVDDNGTVYKKHIEDIQIGDKIINASGIDIVSDIHRREVQYAVKIKVNGQSIISSPNHPYFTQRGWIGAQDLEPNDKVISVYAAMRMVQRGIYNNQSATKAQAILQSILFSEMAHESTRVPSESAYTRDTCENWQEKERMVQVGESRVLSRIGTDSQSESDEQSRNTAKSKPHIENHEAQTFRAWGQWNWIDRSTIEDANGTWERLDSGIQFVTGQTSSRLSDMLQTRLSEYRAKSMYRSGWTLTQESQGTGFEEGYETDFYGVESLEILELGHPELDKFRDADGKLYFYDIGATQHPSFSIGGMLVHNSSILKNYTGKTKQAIIDAFIDTPYKLACSATPAPNDHLELGNHADFLGIMPSSEMIMRWFTNDTMEAGNYRLKKWAEKDFWRWLTSWAVCITKPSDLGDEYDMPEFELPALNIIGHYVAANKEAIQEAWANGRLLPDTAPSSTKLGKVKRQSLDDRLQLCRELVASIPDTEPILIWCNLNDEADALAKAFPEAVEVRGSDSSDVKTKKLLGFSDGQYRMLITKASIAGFGMNYQHCNQMIFFGLDFSFESFYQAKGRCHRYGQTKDVSCHIIFAETEGNVIQILEQKQNAFAKMQYEMANAMLIHGLFRDDSKLALTNANGDIPMILPDWLKSSIIEGTTLVSRGVSAPTHPLA